MTDRKHEDEHECGASTYKGGVWIYLYDGKWYADIENIVFEVFYCPFCGVRLSVKE